jgi:hypothetical protein
MRALLSRHDLQTQLLLHEDCYVLQEAIDTMHFQSNCNIRVVRRHRYEVIAAQNSFALYRGCLATSQNLDEKVVDGVRCTHVCYLMLGISNLTSPASSKESRIRRLVSCVRARSDSVSVAEHVLAPEQHDEQ